MSLTILSTSLVTQIKSTLATPAPIFRPISEIQKKLPTDIIMRLPAYVPTHGRKFYPFYKSKNQMVSIILRSSPTESCEEFSNCIAVHFSVYKPDSLEVRELKDRIQVNHTENIVLKSNVRAIYGFEIFESHVVDKYVIWEQDKFVFHISSGYLSRQEIINVAKSMAKEPLIRSAR
ncbi:MULTISPECIES: hypothetical protein [Calothrix]|uniref:DUF4367 domain-containing protein n=2 Tax=Calothrix TaxID=1186 RepID=A0ABR8AHL1_9CYAN|nr:MULTISPECIES: hypothetical protein [Calothrix]MBD2199506.1 hypothetical protein [Calothrix parietina FACHB-288]MBD2228114.1 hypothetical protein [Calothrix anomala FACHB-343]